ncbi:MAG: hypothetical protein DHS20C15_11110 [Planctomycetota bacterium]|nr:MAG: hypothetical protein DHS20C15_11110 [Planctomycetota bacterium]
MSPRTPAWQSWSDELLERVPVERRPVLLVLVSDAAPHDGGLGARVFDDDAVLDALEHDVIPVRAESHEEPQLAARYHRGGWPTMVLLDGHGEVLEGGTWVDAPELLAMIARARDVLGALPRLPARGDKQREQVLHARLPLEIEAALLSDFDERHGGFGTGQKFPHPEALDYALLRHAEARNPRLLEILEKTLTHMAEGGLHDRVEGGFFRTCEARDWRRPHTEKLLETNAGLTRNYLEAGQLLDRADFLEVGRRTAEHLLEAYDDTGTGLLHSALDPDDEYYAADSAARLTRRPPARSGRFLADANARAISALLKAGAVLERPEFTSAAVRIAENLVRKLVRSGRGVDHVLDRQGRTLPGGLRDEAETARALLLVLQSTDDRRFLPTLEELIERLATREVESLELSSGERSTRILEEAVVAEVLLRAAILLDRPSLEEVGRRLLEQHADECRRGGWAMAAYGRSLELVLHPPLHVVIVGAADDDRTSTLLAAAVSSPVPSRLVQRLDPVSDRDRLLALELPEREGPVAWILHRRRPLGEYAAPRVLQQGLWTGHGERLRS